MSRSKVLNMFWVEAQRVNTEGFPLPPIQDGDWVLIPTKVEFKIGNQWHRVCNLEGTRILFTLFAGEWYYVTYTDFPLIMP
jgi:hypothetical protein